MITITKKIPGLQDHFPFQKLYDESALEINLTPAEVKILVNLFTQKTFDPAQDWRIVFDEDSGNFTITLGDK
jgi:hypothetical protein